MPPFEHLPIASGCPHPTPLWQCNRTWHVCTRTLEAWSRVKAANASSRMLALHRIGGYLFIALFCVMSYYMLARLRGGGDNSPTVTIHLGLAMVLSPLLFVK